MSTPPFFQRNKKLSELTTFGIGGPASYFIEVRSVEEMQNVMQHCHSNKLPFMVLGKGSNCLFDDQGYNGLIILNKIVFMQKPAEGIFHVGAGYSFSLLGAQSARQGWSGLEFASGIPGSVGGAVWMNAGANGSETCSALTSVDFVNDLGEKTTLLRENLSFAYRSSPFQKMSGAIVGATFTLTPLAIARQKQIDIINYRKKTQPLSEKSAGCIFRNPSCGHAGALIEQSQLKGVGVGDAQVSEIHANFIINKGKGSSKDVMQLIDLITNKVKEKTGIHLESEVRCIPYNPVPEPTHD